MINVQMTNSDSGSRRTSFWSFGLDAFIGHPDLVIGHSRRANFPFRSVSDTLQSARRSRHLSTMLRKVDRLLLRVPSLESAIAYYRDVLGLSLVHQEKRLANFKLADGTTELLIHVDPDLPDEAIYYLVDDVRDL